MPLVAARACTHLHAARCCCNHHCDRAQQHYSQALHQGVGHAMRLDEPFPYPPTPTARPSADPSARQGSNHKPGWQARLAALWCAAVDQSRTPTAPCHHRRRVNYFEALTRTQAHTLVTGQSCTLHRKEALHCWNVQVHPPGRRRLEQLCLQVPHRLYPPSTTRHREGSAVTAAPHLHTLPGCPHVHVPLGQHRGQ